MDPRKKSGMAGHRLLHVLAGLLALCAFVGITSSACGAATSHDTRQTSASRKRTPGLFRAIVGMALNEGMGLPPNGVEIVRDVEYGKVGNTSLRLNIIRSASATTTGPLPAVVYIHGGAWRAGSKEQSGPVTYDLAKAGYFCVSINYRLSWEAPFPAQIEDCKCAIRWLRAHASQYNIDPQRIGVYGGSAGGHLAALLGTSWNAPELEGNGGWKGYSSRVQAVVDMFGPTDLFVGEQMQKLRNAGSPGEGAMGPRTTVEMLLGGPIREKAELARRASPVRYISKNDPPFLILHGDQDRVVPLQQSQWLYQQLRRAGVEAKLYVVNGAGHAFHNETANRLIIEFFDQHLASHKRKES